LRPSFALQQGEWSEQVSSWEACGKNQTACPDMYVCFTSHSDFLLGYLIDFCMLLHKLEFFSLIINSIIVMIFLYIANPSKITILVFDWISGKMLQDMHLRALLQHATGHTRVSRKTQP